jgi:hypothetical protein
MAKVIQVIEAEVVRGNGRETIMRPVKQYWSFEGVLLAEADPLPGDDRVPMSAPKDRMDPEGGIPGRSP